MITTISTNELAAMLNAAVEKIRDTHEELSKLDAAIGDGDHGTTMLRVMNSVSESLQDAGDSDLKDLLYKIGWAVMCVDGGSMSPLMGCLFMGMSEAVEGKDKLGQADVASMFDSGLAKMLKQSKASVGDKTMMDALIPAVEAMKTSAQTDEGIDTMLAKARDAAVKGAASTSELVARFGRARNLGERAIGHVDPGATSMSYIFTAFCEGLSIEW